ncbi:hypothetical protein [Rhodohalobacter sp. 8-1]|uniref:hypothetical protein n=1 Tax=Rhodohalobacter sp. 8-1 TaxID=3131972 RepID=UPI0030EE0CD3
MYYRGRSILNATHTNARGTVVNEIMKIMSQSPNYKKHLIPQDKTKDTYKITSTPKDQQTEEEFTQEEMELLAEHARNQRTSTPEEE